MGKHTAPMPELPLIDPSITVHDVLTRALTVHRDAMKAHSSYTIADMVHLSRSKAHCMMYFAQGYCMSAFQCKLFDGNFLARPNGPFLASISDFYRDVVGDYLMSLDHVKEDSPHSVLNDNTPGSMGVRMSAMLGQFMESFSDFRYMARQTDPYMDAWMNTRWNSETQKYTNNVIDDEAMYWFFVHEMDKQQSEMDHKKKAAACDAHRPGQA